MAEIINLNRARKGRAQAEAKRTAEVNRAAFGRTKDEKAKARAEREAVNRTLDGAKREDD